MAEDYLVGSLVLCSACVNILALGAFWVTPSLRTTANRFVINLLFVNFVNCLILSPSLLLNTFNQPADDDIGDYAVSVINLSTKSVTFEDMESEIITNSIPTSKTLIVTHKVKCSNSTKVCESISSEEVAIYAKDNGNREYEKQKHNHSKLSYIKQEKLRLTEIRSWGLDFSVALSVLSVLLVVGDTWCAITDPLRYHSRISNVKAWCLIAGTWILGIIFGSVSACRNDRYGINNYHPSISDDVYNTMFSYTYFFVIILLPFGLVSAMYWRIFIEARESSQRMRQNGSSPLLQSALNLIRTHTEHMHANPSQQQLLPHVRTTAQNLELMQSQQQSLLPIYTQQFNHNQNRNQLCNQQNNNLDSSTYGEGLTMKIDNNTTNNDIINNNNNNNESTQTSLYDDKSSASNAVDKNQKFILSEKCVVKTENEQGATVKLATSTTVQKIRRNYSARQLPFERNFVEKEKDIELMEINELRQSHSTPNIHKLIASEERSQNLCQQAMIVPTQITPRTLRYVNSMRHRLSNASSLFKYREESRAARISILVIIMFLVSYLPYGILVLLQSQADYLESSDQVLLAIFTVLLANISSPFIFAYRNKRVRRGVCRLLGIEKNNRGEKLRKRSTATDSTNTFYRNNNNNISVNSNSNRANSAKASFASPKLLESVDVEKNGYSKIINNSSFISKNKKSILKKVCDCVQNPNKCTQSGGMIALVDKSLERKEVLTINV